MLENATLGSHMFSRARIRGQYYFSGSSVSFMIGQVITLVLVLLQSVKKPLYVLNINIIMLDKSLLNIVFSRYVIYHSANKMALGLSVVL